jgi:hypothetical protein
MAAPVVLPVALEATFDPSEQSAANVAKSALGAVASSIPIGGGKKPAKTTTTPKAQEVIAPVEVTTPAKVETLVETKPVAQTKTPSSELATTISKIKQRNSLE